MIYYPRSLRPRQNPAILSPHETTVLTRRICEPALVENAAYCLFICQSVAPAICGGAGGATLVIQPTMVMSRGAERRLGLPGASAGARCLPVAGTPAPAGIRAQAIGHSRSDTGARSNAHTTARGSHGPGSTDTHSAAGDSRRSGSTRL